MPKPEAMTLNPIPQEDIDPTSGEASKSLTDLFASHSYLPNYTIISSINATTKNPINMVLSHPLYKMVKPAGESKKTKVLKPERTQFVAFEPDANGSGTFGGVFDIVGKWKLTTTGWVYKKSTKEQLVKSNCLYCPESYVDQTAHQFTTYQAKPADVAKSYNKEFALGQYAPHIGFKYPPTIIDDYSFLLMKKLPGVSLERTILALQEKKLQLSATTLLKITINLLKALDPQIHRNTLPPPAQPGTHIVHDDIKPDNILKDENDEVYYVDFGLAVTNKDKLQSSVGTFLFKDPYVLSHDAAILGSKVTDLGSLARVIAELWGDVSRNLVRSKKEIEFCNQNHILSGLCETVDLHEDLKKKVINLITKMTSYEFADRISREKALAEFEKILAKHLEFEAAEISALINEEEFETLFQDHLLKILHSNQVPDFITQLKEKKHDLNLLYTKLGPNLAKIPVENLKFLKEAGLDFAKIQLDAYHIHNYELGAKELSFFLELGANLEKSSFVDWLSMPIGDKGEADWVNICRVLYAKTPNPQITFNETTPQLDFKALFCKKFLINPANQANDKSTIRLIKRHLELEKNEQASIDRIKEEINNFAADTPLAKAVLASPLLNRASDTLLLMPRPEIETLKNAIIAIDSLANSIRLHLLKCDKQFPNRQHTLKAMKDELTGRHALKDIDWETALLNTTQLQNQLKNIIELDGLSKKVWHQAPDGLRDALISQINSCYSDEQITPEELKQHSVSIVAALPFLKEIDRIVNHTRSVDCAMPVANQLDKEYVAFLNSSRIKDSASFLARAEQFNQAYIDIECVLKTLQYHKNQSKPTATNRSNFYRFLQLEVLSTSATHKCATLIPYLNNIKELIVHETNVRAVLLKYPSSFNFIYSAFIENSTNQELSPLMSKSYQKLKANGPLLAELDGLLQCLDKAGEPHKNKLTDLKKIIWDFLTKEQDSKLTLNKINQVKHQLKSSGWTYTLSFFSATTATGSSNSTNSTAVKELK